MKVREGFSASDNTTNVSLADDAFSCDDLCCISMNDNIETSRQNVNESGISVVAQFEMKNHKLEKKANIISLIKRYLETMKEFFIQQLISRRSYKSNVLTHISWISWIVFPTAFWGLATTHDWMTKVFCMVIILLLLIYNIVKYEYWAKHDPNRLQTEYYNLENRRLDIVQAKGDAPRIANPSESVLNPKLLDESKDEEGK